MTAKNRALLSSAADLYLPDNTVGDISPADVRDLVKDLADSAVFPEDLGGPPPLQFASVSGLRAFEAETSAIVAFLTSWHENAGRGGGFFWLDADDTTTADDGGVVLVDAASRRWKRLAADFIDTAMFGAKHDGSTDDSAALQDAFDFAAANPVELRISRGVSTYSTTITVTRSLRVIGYGQRVSVLKYTGGSNGIIVQPDNGYNSYWSFSDFAIIPATDDSGTAAGIVFKSDSANDYASNLHVTRLLVGRFFSCGIYLDNNSTVGVFRLVIDNCWIWNGILGDAIGDSITIRDNTVHSAINRAGVNITSSASSGVRQLVIENNNVTCLGGGTALNGIVAPFILNNWIETPSYLGDFLGVGFGALVYLANAPRATIEGNTIIALHGTGGHVGANYHVAMTGTTADGGGFAVIDNNEFGDAAIGDVNFGFMNGVRLGARNWKSAGGGISTFNPGSGVVTGDAITDGDFSANGLMARTAAGSYASRTLTGTANKITVTNGNGAGGNPTVTIPDAVTLVTPTVTGLLTTNGQVAFPATQNPSSNANTLDDYEEGTFTPVVTASSGTFTTVSATLNYTKIGRLVMFKAVVTITDKGTAAAELRVTLPFAAASAVGGGGTGREVQAVGLQCTVTIAAAASTAIVVTYNGGTIIDSGRTVDIIGQYFT